MSRLGPWSPTSDAERLDRLESLALISQLAFRYALSIDSRDLDAIVGLFAPDVLVGRDRVGRHELRARFAEVLRGPRTSIHAVVNHVVDFQESGRATGIVYCHDDLEQPDTGEWQTGWLQ